MDHVTDTTGHEAIDELGEIGLLDELRAGLATLEADADHDVDDAGVDIEGFDIEPEDPDDVSSWEPPGDMPAVVLEIAGVTVPIADGDSIQIGRGGDHRVADRMVSRRHLRVWREGERVRCEDLRSGNGSWLLRGGHRSPIGDAPVELVPLDRIVTIDDIELLRVDSCERPSASEGVADDCAGGRWRGRGTP